MNTVNKSSIQKNISRAALGVALAAGISLAAGTAFAQDETSMAPPVQSSAPAALGAGTNAAADSVFNWQEIPANQQVPLTRAAFDQGGYQLYDSVGETIIVPFTNDNLYVMKFASSQNGTMYFENEGGYPVLYVPNGGFLSNATVAGARWYPFGQNFHPAEPVFLGIAPSYPEFVDLGWYPNTYFYGGYYGSTPFLAGGVFLPTVGLFFSIGGHPYYGWNSYHRYFFDHPGFYHTSYYNHNFYRYGGSNYRAFSAGRQFGGGGGYAFNHGGGFDHGYTGHSAFAGRAGFGGGSGFSGRTFRGTSNFVNGGHNYSGNRSITVNNNFGGGGQHFGGSQSFSGGQSSSHAFRGASSFGGGSHSSGGGSRSFGSQGGSFGGSRSFGGGSHSFGGGSHSTGQSAHSFSGGRSGGGGGNHGGGDHSR
jgi:hypothetical protein